MLKFLRKYQLILLAIGGSLLMVAFTIEPLLRQFGPNRREEKVAELAADREKVTYAELLQARADVKFLQPFYQVYSITGVLPQLAAGDDEAAYHWLLLTREADQGGYVGGAEDGRDLIPELARQMAQLEMNERLRQNPLQAMLLLQQPGGRQQIEQQIQEAADQITQQAPQIIQALARDARMAPEEGLHALARLRAVTRMALAYYSAPRLSRPRAVELARRDLDSALADALVLQPAAVDAGPAPTDEELEAHWRAHADVQAGDTEANPFGFGYRLPDRLRLAYLRLDRAAIEQAVRPASLDVRRRYTEARDRYPGTFEEERPRVEAAIRGEKVTEILEEATRLIQGAVFAARNRLPEQGRFVELPENWDETRPTLDGIAERVVDQLRERYGPEIPRPEVIRRESSWLTAQDLARLPGIGQSEIRFGANPVPFPAILGTIREINPDGPLPIQEGVPFVDPPAIDPATGDRYFFTVLGTRRAGPADTLAEVRTAVERDLRALRGYEALLARRDELAAAAEGGLEAAAAGLNPEGVVTAADLLVSPVEVRPAAGGMPPPQALQAPDVRSAIVDAARQLPSDAEEPAVVAAEVPAARSLVIARVRQFRPLTEERYRSLGQVAAQREVIESLRGLFDERHPFSFEALADRHKLKILDES